MNRLIKNEMSANVFLPFREIDTFFSCNFMQLLSRVQTQFYILTSLLFLPFNKDVTTVNVALEFKLRLEYFNREYLSYTVLRSLKH